MGIVPIGAWHVLATIALSTALANQASAQPAIKFSEAFSTAWARHPQAQSAQARAEEAEAKQVAAARLMPSPPTLGMSHLSDARFADVGRRSLEAEVSIPLWNVNARQAGIGLASLEASLSGSQISLTKLKFAGDFREVVWSYALAQADAEISNGKLEAAKTLAKDVKLRVQAGDLAPVDASLAESVVAAAEAVVAQSQEQELRAALALEVIAGRLNIAAQEEPDAPATNIEEHPVYRAALLTRDVARARVSNARATQRTGPTATVTLSRERPDRSSAPEKALRFGLAFPLGSEAESGTRIATAQAELIEADADLARMRTVLSLEIALARRAMILATETVRSTAIRARFANEVRTQYAKSFQLGESDLPTQSRVEADWYEAQRSADRAKIEASRARSRLNQALGLLP